MTEDMIVKDLWAKTLRGWRAYTSNPNEETWEVYLQAHNEYNHYMKGDDKP